MKTVILAGGFGTRISEESMYKPKPLIEVSGTPIIVDIMKWYTKFGFDDFVICCGYKGNMLKEYFTNYLMYRNNVYLDFSNNKKTFLSKEKNNWKIHLIDTGLNTQTAGRIYKLKNILKNETFLLTYGDGLSNVDINELVEFHKKNKKICTITLVSPIGRFGTVDVDGSGSIKKFIEKPKNESSWINGGFMVIDGTRIFDWISEDENESFEFTTLKKLAENNELAGYKHNGFWQCMDSLRDKNVLEKLVEENKAPWKIK